MLAILASGVFILAYAAIALEHKLKISKSAVALLAGALLWIMAAVAHHGQVAVEISHAASEVFSIVIFLLAAMSLVEILVHYRFFDLIRARLFVLGLNDIKQFWLISLITFFLSAVIDNLTTTIVMIQISRKFFRGQNLLLSSAGIVIAANAGGAFSPIGDVTTIMLWFAKKFTALEIILKGFLPSFALWAVSSWLIARKIRPEKFDVQNELVKTLDRSEKLIIFSVFLSFAMPVLMTFFGLPPYMGLLLGLGAVWLLVDIFKSIRPKETHLDASIERFIKNTDIPSLKFFVGILFAVSALNVLGILEILAVRVYGENPGLMSIIYGNIGLGFLSAILDNVPLTAIAIQILNVGSTDLWVLLAITVGTGGSLLVIGSAAGVVAMGMVKELTFKNYFKIAFFPALFGYVAGCLVWLVQYFVF